MAKSKVFPSSKVNMKAVNAKGLAASGGKSTSNREAAGKVHRRDICQDKRCKNRVSL